jgi:hypothetical protein
MALSCDAPDVGQIGRVGNASALTWAAGASASAATEFSAGATASGAGASGCVAAGDSPDRRLGVAVTAGAATGTGTGAVAVAGEELAAGRATAPETFAA